MKIDGLQKSSLLDFPDKICATVFTSGCNFRCPFCHNPSLACPASSPQLLKEETIFSFLSKRVGLLDGVCVTGGEPLLQEDLADFLRRVRQLGFQVKLDTNGSFPEKLQTLLQENLLDYVAMDIKNSPEKYPITCDNSQVSLEAIDRSAKLLLKSEISYEFRTTVVREYHTVDEIHRIGQWLQGGQKYTLQNFRDSGALLARNVLLHSLTDEELFAMAAAARQYFPVVSIK